MFRDWYKKANDEIKGDRAILDRAFLQAAQPVKKKNPVIKYSFIGTAVAAVMVLGAVFTNPSVFTNRSKDIGTLDGVEPTATVVAATENEESIPLENNEIAVVAQIEAEDTIEDEAAVEETVAKNTTVNEKPINRTTKQTTEKAQPQSDSGGGEELEAADEEGPAEQADYSLTVMSLDDEENDDAVYEEVTEEAFVGFSLRDRSIVEEPTEELEEITEQSTENVTEAVEVFSYMYDLSVYEGITEGFKNIDVSPVASREEAVERAKVECTIEYDTTDVYRDSIENMWRVDFYKKGAEGGSESVYMNSDGITQLIVYSE